MINKILLVTIFALMILPTVSASQQFQGYGKVNESISLVQTCSNSTSICDSCNISSVNAPNSVALLSNVQMTKYNNQFNYSLDGSNTNTLGTYVVNGYCFAGSQVTPFSFDFMITGNGNAPGGTGVIVFFSIGFLIVLAMMVYLCIYSLGHFVKLDMDLMDVAYSFGAYFALWGLYLLEQTYLGNSSIESILLLAIQVGALTTIFVPLVAFLVSFIYNGLQGKQKHGRYS